MVARRIWRHDPNIMSILTPLVMDSYKKWEVVCGPDETPLRVHKALSHLGLDISIFQGSQFFRIFKTFLGDF